MEISIGSHEMSDIGGFWLPGFDTGGRKLHASGTVRASNMLLASQTLRYPNMPNHQYSMPVWTLRCPLSCQLIDIDCVEYAHQCLHRTNQLRRRESLLSILPLYDQASDQVPINTVLLDK